MRLTRLALLLTFPIALTGSLCAQEIRPEAIRAHMRFLADDLLEGRGTGTRGHQLAADYVTAQFEALGLKPGAGGSYQQTVHFRRTVAVPELCSVVLTREGQEPVTLQFADDFVASGDMLQEDALAEGAVVFAGFGVSAPEQKYDDYASVDVRGKIVAYFTGAPKSFPSDLRAHYSASITKLKNAKAHGAIGVLSFAAPSDHAPRWPFAIRQSKMGAMSWLEPDGSPHDMTLQTHIGASLNEAAAAKLLAGAPLAVEEIRKRAADGKLESFALPVRAAIHLVSKHSELQSPNVVGVLEGSDPELRKEYVVYSAHLDHLGITDPIDGDSINNGALDNASGIAAMLEIARSFAQGPSPKRSIIFLAVTAEEKGLKGSDYFANFPTVPAEDLVADINIDEIYMFTPTKDVTVIGAEHSTLEASAQSAAKQMHLELSPDPFPEEVVFVRSDQYPFVKRGVPSIYAGAGYRAVDPSIDLMAKWTDWDRHIYHSPADDMNQKLDYSVGAQVATFNFLVGLDVANAPERPHWKKGDFFGETFGHPRN